MTEISLAEIFNLNPEIKKGLHPHALKRFDDWIVEIFNEVPQLGQLTIDEINVDINTCLNNDEKARATKYRAVVIEWLWKCTNVGKGYSPYSPVYDTLVISDMSGLKRLVKTAYKHKEEEREREKARQWEEASLHVFPLTLLKEAKRYLNKDDIDKLYDASTVATRVYLKEGDNYLNNYKTFDYRWYLEKIKREKEKERIRLDAEAQAQAFKTRLSHGVEEIEKKLSPEKQAPDVVFGRYCSDKKEKRYLGELFTDILDSDVDREKKWTQGYISAAEAKVQQFIPEDLRVFISMESTAVFFLLPNANYSYSGVPCLDFHFDIFAVVTITVLAQAGSKEFNGVLCRFFTNHPGPEKLGFYQIIISPTEPYFWQSVPISIISNLLAGNIQPPGTTILRRTDRLTEYEVKGFEEDKCEIPICFERYLRDLGSIEKMEESGIIKERTAEILELPQTIISHKENECKGRGSESKKARAFELFNESKRSGDSEVKALGIKPASTYRYYQEWKKLE